MVVNIHAGAGYLRRTMSSLESSARVAAAAGLKVELLLALDRSPPETQSWIASYDSDAFERIRVLELDNGSLGLSRQMGLEAARATYVQFCDEDDLVSSNTTLRCFNTAREYGPRTIVVPEYLYGFGTTHLLAVYEGSDRIPPLAFLAQHPYISRIFVHHEIANTVKYIDVRLGPGYAYEDWWFNATALASGYRFAVARGVILFYRHRANSLSASMTNQSARLIPPSPLFSPPIYLAMNATSARQFKRSGQQQSAPEDERARFVRSKANVNEVRRANRIDPAITLSTVDDCTVMCMSNGDFATGAAYFEACRRVVGQEYNEVALMRSARTGRSAIAALTALSEINEVSNNLVLIDDPDQNDSAGQPLRNATVINLALLGNGLSVEQRSLLAFRLIEISAPDARIHFAADATSAQFLGRYGRLLEGRPKVFYRDDDRSYMTSSGFMLEGAPFDFLSEFFDDADIVVHSSRSGQAHDRARLDRRPLAWRQIYSPMTLNHDLPDPDALDQKVLAIGFSQAEAGNLERLCRDTSLDVVVLMHEGDDASSYDAVIVGGTDEATYADLVTFLSQGHPLIGPATDAMRELPEQHLAVASSTGDSAPSLSDYVAVIAQFYNQPECRRGLFRGIERLFGDRHSNAVYRARIAEVFECDQTAWTVPESNVGTR